MNEEKISRKHTPDSHQWLLCTRFPKGRLLAESADAAAIPRLLRQTPHRPFQVVDSQRKHPFANQLLDHLDGLSVAPVRFR